MGLQSSDLQTRSTKLWSFKLGLPVVVGSLFMMYGCVSTSTYDKAVAQYDTAAKERDALKSNVTMLNNQIANYEQQAEKLGLELDKTSSQLNETSQTLQQREEALQRKAAELQARDEELRTTSLVLSTTTEELQAKEQALKTTEQQLQAAAARELQTHKLYDDLVGELNTELEAKQIKIKEMKDGLIVNLSEAILFPSGSAVLNKQGKEVITKVSDKLQSANYQTVVAGFTDDIPISGSLAKRYPTNWELAGARAASVVRLLEKNGLDSHHLMALSYGENHPLMPNDTADGRAQNRRIEIRLKPIQ